MALIWLLTAVTWAGHIGLLLVPGSLLSMLLAGRMPVWTQAVLWAALLPQLILVPWAWRDAGKRHLGRGQLWFWRLFFFFTGFIAVTVYAVRFCTGRRAGRI